MIATFKFHIKSSIVSIKFPLNKVLLTAFLLLSFTVCFAQQELDFELCPAITQQAQPVALKGLDNWLFHSKETLTTIAIEDNVQDRLKDLYKALKYKGIEVVFANLPTRLMMHNEKLDETQAIFKNYDLSQTVQSYLTANEVLSEVGFTVPNLYDYLVNTSSSDFAYKRDTHWNPTGASHVATALQEVLAKSSTYQKMNYKAYTSELIEVIQRDSDIAKYVKAVCNIPISLEPQPTYRLATTDTSTSLLGEDSTSQLLLWGTSYSRISNFYEFLQAATDVEVLNYAYGHSGLWGSITSYFLESDKTVPHPKLAIWEAPYWTFEEFNNTKVYRELIPTIYGACQDDLQIIPEHITELKDQSVNLLSESEMALESTVWRAIRSSIQPQAMPDHEEAIKIVFSGKKDPWIHLDFETNSPLSNKAYEFSVWLWTDSDQPKSAALYLYSGNDVSVETINLTQEPTQYIIKKQFVDSQNTGFTVRIDGLQNQNTDLENSAKNAYMFAASPQLSKASKVDLMTIDIDSLYGPEFYTHLTFEDLSINDFQLIYEFEDNTTITETISRNPLANTGEYFFELPKNNTSTIKKIQLSVLRENALGTVSSNICKKPE